MGKLLLPLCFYLPDKLSSSQRYASRSLVSLYPYIIVFIHLNICCTPNPENNLFAAKGVTKHEHSPFNIQHKWNETRTVIRGKNQTFLNITLALVPPKPKEFESAISTFFSLVLCGTRSIPPQPSDTLSRLRVGGTKLVSIAFKQ